MQKIIPARCHMSRNKTQKLLSNICYPTALFCTAVSFFYMLAQNSGSSRRTDGSAILFLLTILVLYGICYLLFHPSAGKFSYKKANCSQISSGLTAAFVAALTFLMRVVYLHISDAPADWLAIGTYIWLAAAAGSAPVVYFIGGLLGRGKFSRRCAFAAGLLYALLPAHIGNAGTLGIAAIAELLILLAFFLLLSAHDAETEAAKALLITAGAISFTGAVYLQAAKLIFLPALLLYLACAAVLHSCRKSDGPKKCPHCNSGTAWFHFLLFMLITAAAGAIFITMDVMILKSGWITDFTDFWRFDGLSGAAPLSLFQSVDRRLLALWGSEWIAGGNTLQYLSKLYTLFLLFSAAAGLFAAKKIREERLLFMGAVICVLFITSFFLPQAAAVQTRSMIPLVCCAAYGFTAGFSYLRVPLTAEFNAEADTEWIPAESYASYILPKRWGPIIKESCSSKDPAVPSFSDKMQLPASDSTDGSDSTGGSGDDLRQDKPPLQIQQQKQASYTEQSQQIPPAALQTDGENAMEHMLNELFGEK